MDQDLANIIERYDIDFLVITFAGRLINLTDNPPKTVDANSNGNNVISFVLLSIRKRTIELFVEAVRAHALERPAPCDHFGFVDPMLVRVLATRDLLIPELLFGVRAGRS